MRIAIRFRIILQTALDLGIYKRQGMFHQLMEFLEIRCHLSFLRVL